MQEILRSWLLAPPPDLSPPNSLDTHKKNEAAVTAAYSPIIVHIDGNRARDAVFEDISKALKALR